MRKLYKAIFETDTEAFKVYRTASSVSAFKTIYGGNGDIITIKDVTEDYPLNISLIIKALKNAGFSEIEIDAVASIIQHEYDNCI